MTELALIVASGLCLCATSSWSEDDEFCVEFVPFGMQDAREEREERIEVNDTVDPDRAWIMLIRVTRLVVRWRDRARRTLLLMAVSFANKMQDEMRGSCSVLPKDADPGILANLEHRRKIYGDVCFGRSSNELRRFVAHGGNSAPVALLLLHAARQQEQSRTTGTAMRQRAIHLQRACSQVAEQRVGA